MRMNQGVTKEILIFAVATLFLFSMGAGAGDWPTFGHDPQRSGWAVGETALTPQSVGGLELKWKVHLNNAALSLTALTAPIVADHVNTAHGVKDVVYVGGSSDHLFAIDAANGNMIWSYDFGTHILPKDAGMWLCPNNLNATPVADRQSNAIYAISSDGRLWGLDLGTGVVNFGPVQFVPPYSKNWSLNIHGHTLYTSISQGCGGAQSGIYSVNFGSPKHPIVHAFFDSSTGGSGIWGRGGPVVGLDGHIYAATGDGPFDPAAGDFGSSFIKASLNRLKILDYFAPNNFRYVTSYDLDIAASSPVWFAYKNFDLLAGGGKEGVLYLLDAASLGEKDHHTPFFTLKLANDEGAFEGKGIWGAPAVWRDKTGDAWLYVPIYGLVSKDAPQFPITNGATPHGSVMAFKVAIDRTSGKAVLTPAWISDDFDLPDPPAVADGVVFVLSTGENPLQTTGAQVIYSGQKLLTTEQREANTYKAVLYALDAKTGKVLYKSGDAMATWVHFSGLAIAGGQVYAVDHDSNLYCFGLKEKQ